VELRRGKVLVQVVESTSIVWKDLSLSLMYATWIECYLKYSFLFNYILNAWCDDKFLKSKELSQLWFGWIGCALALWL